MNDYRGQFSRKEREYLDERFKDIIFFRLPDGTLKARHCYWDNHSAVEGSNVDEIEKKLDSKLLRLNG